MENPSSSEPVSEIKITRTHLFILALIARIFTITGFLTGNYTICLIASPVVIILEIITLDVAVMKKSPFALFQKIFAFVVHSFFTYLGISHL